MFLSRGAAIQISDGRRDAANNKKKNAIVDRPVEEQEFSSRGRRWILKNEPSSMTKCHGNARVITNWRGSDSGGDCSAPKLAYVTDRLLHGRFAIIYVTRTLLWF